jgi:atypical dual specificity phosphatase
MVIMVMINWVIEDKLAGSPFPSTEELEEIYNHGIRAILSLDYRRDEETLRSMGFKHKTINIHDYTAPTLEQLDEACEFIEMSTSSGDPVLVHCLVGQGRTGTVICAYLISRGFDYIGALEKVRTRIPHAVEIEAQLQILEEFYRIRKRL